MALGRVGDQARGGIGTGGRVAQVTPKCGPTLDLDAANNGGRVDEAGVAVDDFTVVVDAPAGHRRADGQPAAGAIGKLVGLGDVFDIDDAVGGEALAAQLDDQIGAAGESPGVCALLGLQRHGFAKRTGCTELEIIQGSVDNLRSILEERSAVCVDAIISGLPWTIFESNQQERMITSIRSSLCPKGQFSTFIYLQGLILPGGRRLVKLLEKNFKEVVRTKIVWANLPPAVIFKCRP